MKSKSTKTLQIITGVYSALYVIAILISYFEGELSFSDLTDNLFLLLFVLFIVGFALSWTREKIAGIIFMVWNAGVWLYALFLFRERDSGMFCIMAVPVMVIGALLLLRWHKTTASPVPSEKQQWKFILRVLLINYAVLYAIIVISEITDGKPIDYFRLPFILFPMLLLIFIVGFILSWKREFQAGIIFLLWYAIMFFGSVAYFEFRDSGPWILFGVPILLQGLFYLKNNPGYKTSLKQT